MEEVSEFTKAIAAVRSIEDNHILSIGEVEPYKYICVSPIYDEKSGNILYRTHVEHGRTFTAGEREDEKDIEIKKLKEELHRRDLDIQRQQARLRRIRPSEFEEEKSIVSDKFVDKQSKVDTIKRRLFSATSVDNVGGLENSPNGSQCSAQRKKIVPTVPVQALQEAIVSRRRDGGEESCTFPDLDRSDLSSECAEITTKVQETVSVCFSSIQLSLENLRNRFKLHDIQNIDSSQIGDLEIKAELSILEKTITKLKEICQEPCNQGFPSKNMNHQIDGVKVGFQNTINRMIQKLSCAEQKITALESSCIDKGKKIDELEDRIQVMLKDKDVLVEKYEMASAVREMCKEATKQRSGITEILSLNEAKMTNELKSTKTESPCRCVKDMKIGDIGLSQRLCGNIVQQENESLRSKNEILKLKLSWAEFQLSQQEVTLQRLMSYLNLYEEHSPDEFEDQSRYMMTEDLYHPKHIKRRDEAREFLDELELKMHHMEIEVSKHIKEIRAIADVF